MRPQYLETLGSHNPHAAQAALRMDRTNPAAMAALSGATEAALLTHEHSLKMHIVREVKPHINLSQMSRLKPIGPPGWWEPLDSRAPLSVVDGSLPGQRSLIPSTGLSSPSIAKPNTHDQPSLRGSHSDIAPVPTTKQSG